MLPEHDFPRHHAALLAYFEREGSRVEETHYDLVTTEYSWRAYLAKAAITIRAARRTLEDLDPTTLVAALAARGAFARAIDVGGSTVTVVLHQGLVVLRFGPAFADA